MRTGPKIPSDRAANTDRWTETMFRALASRVGGRWQFASFRGVNGGEWCGVVDVLAVRKNTSPPDDPRLKRGDMFEFILVQMKGGSAGRPSDRDIDRLRLVQRRYRARDIVLFEWNKGRWSRFWTLQGKRWTKAPVREIFA
jgi:hypothetical protein